MIVFEGEVTDKDCLHFLKKRQIFMYIFSYIFLFCGIAPFVICFA